MNFFKKYSSWSHVKCLWRLNKFNFQKSLYATGVDRSKYFCLHMSFLLIAKNLFYLATEPYLTSLKSNRQRTSTGRAPSLISDIWLHLGLQKHSFVHEGRDLCGYMHASTFILLTCWGIHVQVSEWIGTSCTLEIEIPSAVSQTILFIYLFLSRAATSYNLQDKVPLGFSFHIPQCFGYMNALYLDNAGSEEPLAQPSAEPIIPAEIRLCTVIMLYASRVVAFQSQPGLRCDSGNSELPGRRKQEHVIQSHSHHLISMTNEGDECWKSEEERIFPWRKRNGIETIMFYGLTLTKGSEISIRSISTIVSGYTY